MGNRHLPWGPLPGHPQLLRPTARNLVLGIPYLFILAAPRAKEEHQIPLPLQQHPLSASLVTTSCSQETEKPPNVLYVYGVRIRPFTGSTRWLDVWSSRVALPTLIGRSPTSIRLDTEVMCAVPCFLSPSRGLSDAQGMCPALGLSSSRGPLVRLTPLAQPAACLFQDVWKGTFLAVFLIKAKSSFSLVSAPSSPSPR